MVKKLINILIFLNSYFKVESNEIVEGCRLPVHMRGAPNDSSEWRKIILV